MLQQRILTGDVVGPADILEGEDVHFGSTQPTFLLTVDTEEEFDWGKGFDRRNNTTTHLPAVKRFQSLCEARGVQPVYFIDYPVATDDYGAEWFGDLSRSGKAEIGMHLHPWVTPPFDEEVCTTNSYACNLPQEIEAAKLRTTSQAIEKATGSRPVIFRAGRYGASAQTLHALQELGVRLDSSVRSHFDFRNDNGPDFTHGRDRPYRIAGTSIVELPLTTMFAGLLRDRALKAYGSESEPNIFRGVFARTRLLSRLPLTPEGTPIKEAKQAVDLAVKDGLPLLMFSFHSPSLEPGHTPYVRNQSELDQFYAWFEEMFDHLERRGVAPATVKNLADQVAI